MSLKAVLSAPSLALVSLALSSGCADECATTEDCVRGQEVCESGECVAKTFVPPPPVPDAGVRPDATTYPDAAPIDTDAGPYVPPDAGFTEQPLAGGGLVEVYDVADDILVTNIAEARFWSGNGATANRVERRFPAAGSGLCTFVETDIMSGAPAPIDVGSVRVTGLQGYSSPLSLTRTSTGFYSAVDNLAATPVLQNPGRSTFEIISDGVVGHPESTTVEVLHPPAVFVVEPGGGPQELEDREPWMWIVNDAWRDREVVVEVYTYPNRESQLTCRWPELSTGMAFIPHEAAQNFWVAARNAGVTDLRVETRREVSAVQGVPLVGGGTMEVTFRVATGSRRRPL